MRRLAALAALAGLGVLTATAIAQPRTNCHKQHNCPPPTTTTTTATTVTGGGYLFDDEFNGAAGSKPSSTQWTALSNTGPSGTVNDGFTEVSQDGNGNLNVTAENLGGVWHSAHLVSTTSYSGPRYVETRAQVACGDGTWNGPAWEWAYPFGGSTGSGQENDVVEQLGRQPTANNTTLHVNENTSTPLQASFLNNSGVTLCDAFHTYGAAVYSDHVDYFLDGQRVRTITAAELGGNWGFDTASFAMNINLQMGGSFGGPITVTGPVHMLVDYVRVSRLP